MANTGERHGTTTSGFTANPANAIDGNDGTDASIIHFTDAALNVIISSYGGDDIPTGATINGVEIRIRASFASIFPATKLIDVELSKNGASGTFNSPSSGATSTVLSSTVTDYTFGGSSETWQHSWNDFTDISELAIKFTSDQVGVLDQTTITTIFAAAITVYYEVGDLIIPRLKINSGKVTIKGGNFTIK